MPRNLKKDYPYYKVHYVRDLRDLVNRRCEMYPDSPVFKFKCGTTASPHPHSNADLNGKQNAEQKVGHNGDSEWKAIYPKDFREDIQRLGSGLLRLWNAKTSVEQRKAVPKIAILSETRYEWYVSYMAATNGLGIVVPLDRMLRAEELVTMFQRAGIDMVLFSKKYTDTVGKVMSECSNLKVAVCFDECELQGAYTYKEASEIAGDKGEYNSRRIDPDAVGILLFTSGTTSQSKIVMLSQRNVCSDIMNMFKMCSMGPGDSFLSVLPLHHTYECTCGFIAQVYSGTTIYIGEGLTKIASDLQKAKPTCLCVVPALLEKFYGKIMKEIQSSALKRFGFAMLRGMSRFLYLLRIDARKVLFKKVNDVFGGNLRLVFMGGAPSDPNVIKFFDEIGVEVLQGYGLTECAPLVAVNRDQNYRYNSAGVPLVGNEIKVYQSDENGIGEFIVKGDNVFLGYYGNLKATDEVFDKDGYFHTGDVGYIDDDGFLYITGRKKNVIIAKNGKNVFPEELEYLINKSPLVCESVVSQKENETGNDYIIQAEIFPQFDEIRESFGEISADEIRMKIEEEISRVNKKLENYQKIKKVIIRDTEFIKSSTHKIKRCA